ncbi:MAG: hypothetical protein U1A22_15765 [Xanthomonadaceae bacterium]|nr:hypothetical protein [Xanthomonadaceae bacterium]
MTLNSAKWLLATIWLVGGGLVFLLLVGGSIGNRYDPNVQDAWGWFLPTVMPTLLLIVGVLVADHQTEAAADQAARPVAGRLLWLGATLSVVYLVLVALSVLIPAFWTHISPLELMQRSNLWLGPLQGLTAAVLAAFFRGR